MIEEYRVDVRGEVDVITARIHVRDLARALGMNLGDQARISLAASSLAHALGLGETCQGQIEVTCIHSDARVGVQVTCRTPDALVAGTFNDARWMVDELTITAQPTGGLQVAAIKWLTLGTDHER